MILCQLRCSQLKLRISRFYSTIKPQDKYDAIIVGGGHNGLISAAYLAKGGKKVGLFERRHILGGAAVTEEIIPEFKFSRASYVLGLLRPQIYNELELKKHGLEVCIRNPSSYTPVHETYWPRLRGKSLTLGPDEKENFNQISQFSIKDAESFPKYEATLNKFIDALSPLLDLPPLNLKKFFESGLLNQLKAYPHWKPLVKAGRSIGKDLPDFYKLMTAPASRVLREWFESEPLMATLATDSVIGAMISPSSPGSSYVLLHHVMAQCKEIKGAWGYPIGGMGSVTGSIAKAAREAGAHLFTDKKVEKIVLNDRGQVEGIKVDDSIIKAPLVLSNATPQVTFFKLLPEGVLPPQYEKEIRSIDYTSPVCKINVALKCIPNFKADPNLKQNEPMPHHRCTIHLNCEDMDMLEEAFEQGKNGSIPDRPMIELTIPSSCDNTLAPKGCHVALLFTQYVPYTLRGNVDWSEGTKIKYAEKIFDVVEDYAPGFKSSIVGYEVLPPPDLERIFGLTGGNIFHGSMSLDQLYMCRPTTFQSSPFTPIEGLVLCGSGAHPGGGVMGAPGKIAASAILAK